MMTYEQEREISQFVSREVIYCVSALVSSLRDAVFNGSGIDGFTEDDYYAICVKDDWETPVEEFLNSSELDDLQIWYEAYGNSEDVINHNEPNAKEKLVHEVMQGLAHNKGFREFADDHNLDSYTVEAYEHWIVSNWLALKLEEKGEMIGWDICGLTIWGRTTTGQSIVLDSVIQEIYKELHGE